MTILIRHDSMRSKLNSIVMALGAASVFMNGSVALSGSNRVSLHTTIPSHRPKQFCASAFTSTPNYSFNPKQAKSRPRLPSRVPVCPLRPNAPLARRILSQPTIYVVEENKAPKESVQIMAVRADKPPYAMNTQQLVYVWLCRHELNNL